MKFPVQLETGWLIANGYFKTLVDKILNDPPVPFNSYILADFLSKNTDTYVFFFVFERYTYLFNTFHKYNGRKSMVDQACIAGNLEIIQFLCKHKRYSKCTKLAMDNAAQHNHLEVVKYLHYNRKEGCTTDAMDKTSSLEIIKFLHYNRLEGCTTKCLENAVIRNDFETVQFLLENNIGRVGVNLLSAAMFNDRKDMAIHLYNNILTQLQKKTLSQSVLSNAAYLGYLDVVKLLNEDFVRNGVRRVNEPLDEKVLVAAASQGHLEVVKYIVEQTPSPKYADYLLKRVAEGGHLEVFKYLINKNLLMVLDKSLIKTLVSVAIRNNHLPLLEYLHCRFELTVTKMYRSVQNGSLELVKYLVEKLGVKIKPRELILAVIGGRLDTLRYLMEERGVKPKTSPSLMVLAFRKCYPEIIQYLFDSGYKFDELQEDSMLFFPQTTPQNRYRTLKLILDPKNKPIQNICPRTVTSLYSNMVQDPNLFSMVFQTFNGRHIRLIPLLASAPIPVMELLLNLPDFKERETPLTDEARLKIACIFKSYPYFKHLIEKKGVIPTQSVYNIACCKGWVQIVKYLKFHCPAASGIKLTKEALELTMEMKNDNVLNFFFLKERETVKELLTDEIIYNFVKHKDTLKKCLVIIRGLDPKEEPDLYHQVYEQFAQKIFKVDDRPFHRTSRPNFPDISQIEILLCDIAQHFNNIEGQEYLDNVSPDMYDNREYKYENSDDEFNSRRHHRYDDNDYNDDKMYQYEEEYLDEDEDDETSWN
eukprot:gene3345-4194_t